MKILYALLATICLIVGMATVTTVEAFGGEVTSSYGYRIHPIFGTYTMHNGVDIGLDENTVYPAPYDGYVTTGYESGYGYWLQLDMADGSALLFGHLNGYYVTSGYVTKGTPIALSGSSGNSTGPHAHIGYFPHGYNEADSDDPVPILQAAGWDLSGDLSGNTIGEMIDGMTGKFKKVIPHIDINWTTYFVPSDTLVKISKTLLSKFTESFGVMQLHLMDTLVALITLDLLWYLGKCLVWAEVFNPQTMLLKLMRYGFFGMLLKGWQELCSNLFIPLFESLSQALGNTNVAVEKFLAFDELFTNLTRIAGSYMNLRYDVIDAVTDVAKMGPLHAGSSSLGVFIASNIIMFILLMLCIMLSIYVLTKVCQFYIICIFGAIGIPLAFVPFLNRYHAGTALGAVFTQLFHLLIISLLFQIMITILGTIQPLPADKMPDLLIFAFSFGLLCVWVSFNTDKYAQYFSNIMFRL